MICPARLQVSSGLLGLRCTKVFLRIPSSKYFPPLSQVLRELGPMAYWYLLIYSNKPFAPRLSALWQNRILIYFNCSPSSKPWVFVKSKYIFSLKKAGLAEILPFYLLRSMSFLEDHIFFALHVIFGRSSLRGTLLWFEPHLEPKDETHRLHGTQYHHKHVIEGSHIQPSQLHMKWQIVNVPCILSCFLYIDLWDMPNVLTGTTFLMRWSHVVSNEGPHGSGHAVCSWLKLMMQWKGQAGVDIAHHITGSPYDHVMVTE